MTPEQAREAAREYGPGWISVDLDGDIWWNEKFPNYECGCWCSDGRMEYLGRSGDWRTTLEKVGE